MRVAGKFLATSMALMLLLVLGCGGGDDGGQAQSAPPATISASGATQAQESAPVSVGTPTGSSVNTVPVLSESIKGRDLYNLSQADQVTALLGIYWTAFNEYDADAIFAAYTPRVFEENPELGAKVQPLFVSIDPQRDTPEVLTEFTDAFHPRLIGMTGSKKQLDKAASDFAVFYSKGEETSNGGYLMDHSNQTYLFGPDGQPLALLPTSDGPDAVAAELAKWVR